MNIVLTEKFLIKLKLSKTPVYRLAIAAGVHPETFGKLVRGQMRMRPMDQRILQVGELLGLGPDEIFCQGESGEAA